MARNFLDSSDFADVYDNNEDQEFIEENEDIRDSVSSLRKEINSLDDAIDSFRDAYFKKAGAEVQSTLYLSLIEERDAKRALVEEYNRIYKRGEFEVKDYKKEIERSKEAKKESENLFRKLKSQQAQKSSIKPSPQVQSEGVLKPPKPPSIASAPSGGRGNSDVRALYREAEKVLQNGNLYEAQKLAEDILELDPLHEKAKEI